MQTQQCSVDMYSMLLVMCRLHIILTECESVIHKWLTKIKACLADCVAMVPDADKNYVMHMHMIYLQLNSTTKTFQTKFKL